MEDQQLSSLKNQSGSTYLVRRPDCYTVIREPHFAGALA